MANWFDSPGAWIAAIAALAAIVGAGASLLVYVVERRRDRSRTARDRSAQASGVSVWMNRREDDLVTSAVNSVVSVDDPGRNLEEEEDEPPSWPSSIEGHNGSRQPVYNVRIYLWVGAQQTTVFLWQSLAVLPPSTETLVISNFENATRAQQRLMRTNRGVSIEFSDAEGLRWYRGRNGVLSRLDTKRSWQEVEGLPKSYLPEDPPDWLRQIDSTWRPTHRNDGPASFL